MPRPKTGRPTGRPRKPVPDPEEGLPPPPTPEEIRIRSTAIRAGWTRQQRSNRRAVPEYMPRVVSTTDARAATDRLYYESHEAE